MERTVATFSISGVLRNHTRLGARRRKVVRSIPAPVLRSHGITLDNDVLWAVASDFRSILKIDQNDGKSWPRYSSTSRATRRSTAWIFAPASFIATPTRAGFAILHENANSLCDLHGI